MKINQIEKTETEYVHSKRISISVRYACCHLVKNTGGILNKIVSNISISLT